MILEKWARKAMPGGGFTDPDSPLSIAFEGVVYGHPEVKDGTRVVIPRMKRFDFRENAFRDESNRLVRVRTPDEGYEVVFPQAKKKLEKAIIDRKLVG